MLQKRLINVIILLAVIFAIGVAGYMIIEGWRFMDAIYMTVITIATVGYGETNPLSQNGRIFTMFFILGGMGVLMYGISTVTAFLVEGQLTDVLRRRRMQARIDNLNNHFIVCGADKTAEYIIDEMIKTKKDFVVIEKDNLKIKTIEEKGILCVEGDATHDAVLNKANIKNAKGLVTVLKTDAENLLVILTAKGINPSLRIISKAVEEESEEKLRRAGADGVVSPNRIGGLRIVSELIRPSVVTFLDLMLREKDKTIRVEDIDICDESPFIGKTLSETGVLECEDLTVVALGNKEDRSYKFNPPPTTRLKKNDVIIVVGKIEGVEKIRSKTKP